MPTTAEVTRALRRLTSDWNNDAHAAHGWPQFLRSVKINGLRGWTGESIEFRFPIVALAGENGSGKSTVLKAVASGYINSDANQKTINPDDFFPTTQWEDVAGVSLEYSVQEGPGNPKLVSVRKPTKRWINLPARLRRRVFFLDITRTQPIDSLIGYGKIAKEGAFGESEVELDDANRQRLARVLRRDYTEGKLVVSETGKRKEVGVVTRDGTTYSNFHQGAGEDSTMDLIALLQRAPSHSLVVIDELEASLHPRAQRRLVGELFDLARTKRLQLILSTHSPFVLELLSEQAKVYIQSGSDGARNVLYGISHQLALTMMDDEQHPELHVYVEDERARVLTIALAVTEAPDFRDRLKIVPVGPSNVVRALGTLADADKLPDRTLCVLDADETPAPGCIILPGNAAPEVDVFASLGDDDWEALARRLAVSVARLKEVTADAMNVDDHHLWPDKVADGLGGLTTGRRVWEEFCEHYATDVVSAEERLHFVDQLRDALPT
jgi:predicted ATPase